MDEHRSNQHEAPACDAELNQCDVDARAAGEFSPTGCGRSAIPRRQREMVAMLRRGYSAEQIAQARNVAVDYVRKQLRRAGYCITTRPGPVVTEAGHVLRQVWP